MSKLTLNQVTLCAVSGVAVDATISALMRSLQECEFAAGLLVTDGPVSVRLPDCIVHVRAASLRSRQAYSRFVLSSLSDLIKTSHLLLVQWDGFVLHAGNWTDEFLDVDYIGAPWPQFPAERAVGNGGFSLRSRRLLNACLDPDFEIDHPEDIAICHRNRAMLEQRHGIRFAPLDLARRFSTERSGDVANTFGFHGAFRLAEVLEPHEYEAMLLALAPGEIGRREVLDILATPDTPTAARRHLRRLYSAGSWPDARLLRAQLIGWAKRKFKYRR